jgi:predicted RNA-binding protein with RPS1 domain
MKFTNSALALAAALISAPFASAFTAPGAAFVSTRVATTGVTAAVKSGCGGGCNCPSCAVAPVGGCSCGNCGGSATALRMSEEPAAEAAEVPAETAEVPAEVVALDGVASEEEAHNSSRPARDSGTKKHKKGGNAGTPLSELEVGSFIDGTVKTITPYGAFVDIGAATDALLHVSRLSAEFVSNVEDVVKAGDAVSVRIVEVNAEKKQVAISMLSEEDESAAKTARGGGRRKDRPQRSGGDRAAQAATINSLNDKGYDDTKMVEGEVVSTLDFGAFVRFDAGQVTEGVEGELDGLVHISALAAGRVNSVNDIANVGDKVQIRVRQLDVDGGKVSLSMITKEEEEASRPKRNNNRRGRQMFSEDEMGAKDWKESLEKFQAANHVVTNMPIIVDKRKTTA